MGRLVGVIMTALISYLVAEGYLPQVVGDALLESAAVMTGMELGVAGAATIGISIGARKLSDLLERKGLIPKKK